MDPLQGLLHEKLLQAFICQVDAQLLEAVVLQALKTVDVQCPDACAFLGRPWHKEPAC